MRFGKVGTVTMARLAVGCSMAALVAPQAVMAQDAPAPAEPEEQARPASVNDIIVVARRREENIQDVPASVGILAGEALQARNIIGFTDIKASIANVSTVQNSAPGASYLAIRGQTSISSPNIALDSQVGIYVDGVYLGRAQTSGGDLTDIARLEVYRGPQGTLFGRNSTAGAINFITGAPTGEFGADALVSYGNYDRKFGRVTLNSPDLGGLAFRLTYQHEDYLGDVRNANGGRFYTYNRGFGRVRSPDRLGSRNSEAIVAKVRYDGLDGVTLDYKYDYSTTTYSPTSAQAFGFISTTTGAAGARLFGLQQPGAVRLDMNRKLFELNLDGEGNGDVEVEGHLFNAAIELSDTLSVKSITARRTLSVRGPLDLDLGVIRQPVSATSSIPLGLLHSSQFIDQEQFSQEVQLLGTFKSLDFILGGFHFHEKAQQNQLQGSLPLVPGADGLIPVPDSAVNQRDRTNNKSYAVYGHLDLRPFDGLEIGLGARYTWDKKQTTDVRGASPVVGRIKDDKLTYDASINYEVVPDINFYGRYAFGYVVGGIARGIAYGREETNSYEIGLKTQFFDRRLTFNVSAFHTKSVDLQRAIFVPGTGLAFFNIGTLKVDGFEIETIARPVDGLTLTANYGHSDPKASDGSLPITPPKNFSFAAEYETPPIFGNSALALRIDGDYRSTYYANNLNTAQLRSVRAPLPQAIWAAYGSQAAYNDALLKELDAGDYWQFNGRLSLKDISLGQGNARLTGYVKNIFNNRGKLFVVDYGVIAGGTFERERTYGVELAMTF